jgi:hypothetical protein
LLPMRRIGSGIRLSRNDLFNLSGPRPSHYFARIFPGLTNLSALSWNRTVDRAAVP